MGIFTTIDKRNLDITTPVEQPAGKVMTTPSSDKSTYISPLLYHNYNTITAQLLTPVNLITRI